MAACGSKRPCQRKDRTKPHGGAKGRTSTRLTRSECVRFLTLPAFSLQRERARLPAGSQAAAGAIRPKPLQLNAQGCEDAPSTIPSRPSAARRRVGKGALLSLSAWAKSQGRAVPTRE